MSELSIGVRVLGRYRILRSLGRGGMGVVYLGRTEGAAGFSRPVVIKRVLAELANRADVNEMFAREARILASLQHPNIVNVIDFGLEDGAYVMVLEYVHGYDLNLWSRFAANERRRLRLEYVLYVVRKILAALQHAHEALLPEGAPANIVHRDVSLSNVLLDLAGQVKLHDFGIARIDDGGEMLTQTGVFKGKLALAAPEQLRGLKATRQSDIYSCGVLIYQLLSGRNPFQGQTEAETVFRIAEHVPPPLSGLRADVPKGLDDVVTRALQKAPPERFASAAEFADQLAAFCPRADELVVNDLRVELARDFAALAERLGVESLGARDAAWREAQTASHAILPLDSFRISAAPPADVEAPIPAPAPPRPPKQPEARLKPLLVPLGAGFVALAVLVLAAGGNPRRKVEPSYLVVESPGVQPQPSADPVVAAPPPPSPAASGGASPSPSPPTQPQSPSAEQSKLPSPKPAAPARAPEAPSPPNPAELSRQFRVHQPDVEACYRQHADPVAETERTSLRFEVDRAGRVQRANVLPPSREGTPLGKCLLGIAAQTRFGSLTEPAAFSIPITARRGAQSR